MPHGFFSALALAEDEPATAPGAAAGTKGSGSRRGGRAKRLSGRRWITRGDSLVSNEGGEWQICRLVSYNVLAKCYAKQKHFTSCKAEHLRWSERRVALIEVLDELEADILCLQEVEDYDKFWYKELSAKGYHGVYKKRNSHRKYDGCATFYKADKFERIDVKDIEFDQHLPSPADMSPDFATHNIALITVFKPVGRESGGCFCVANAHLFWDPTYEDLKISQARALVRAAEDLASQHGGAPIILAGDFNSVPESCVYSFMTSAAAFKSAYASISKSNQTNPNSPSTHGPMTPPTTTMRSSGGGAGDPPAIHVGVPASSSSSSSSSSQVATASVAAAALRGKKTAAGGEGNGNGNGNKSVMAAGRGGAAAPPGGGGLIFTKLLNPHASAFNPGAGGGSGAGVGRGGGGIAGVGRGGSGMIQAMGPGSSSMQVMGPTSPVVAPSNPSQMPGSPGQGQQGGGRKGQGAGEPAFTNYRDIFNGAIDYIFVRCVGGRKIEVRACLGMIGEAEASREGGGLPSSRHPSDHLPIAADLGIF